MKIVQFKDGTFGVRRRARLFGYEFLDANLTWHERAHSFCRFPSREQAESYRAWRIRVDTERTSKRKKSKDKGVPV